MMTVWAYMAIDYEAPRRRFYKRHVFFYAAAEQYNGAWLEPSDCIWIVPGTLVC